MRISERVQGFTESVIREMTRVVALHGGVNLAQGMPDFPPPPEVVEAAHRALDGEFHQYAITWGAPRLRRAIADKYGKLYGMDVDPDRHVTVCCGSTETMLSTLLAVLNPGDQVIIFEPFYENYGLGHTPIATLPGMADRTVTISGISKSYSVTGWRVGYAVAPPDISVGIRRAHDFVTVGAPHPLQEAAVTALTLPDSYYVWLREMYQAKRDLLFGRLLKAGFVAWKPRGAYYILTDAAHFLERYGIEDDTAFAMFLIKHIGVATVPGSSFYAHPELGRTKIRFCFPKTDEVLQEAGERLQKLRS